MKSEDFSAHEYVIVTTTNTIDKVPCRRRPRILRIGGGDCDNDLPGKRQTTMNHGICRRCSASYFCTDPVPPNFEYPQRHPLSRINYQNIVHRHPEAGT
jgi:hypothetical protein